MSNVQAWFNRLWYSPTLLHRVISVLLLPLAALLQIVARRRRAKQSAHAKKLSVPVIVIGNITIGGTGKTPVIIELAKALVARGYIPGVVSRGYGGASASSKNPSPLLLCDQTSVDESGDEPALIRQALSLLSIPVCVCVDRNAAAEKLIAEGCNVILSDDGLQHYRLNRQLELVVVDASRCFGNARTLPAGPLREPKSRLDEVDAVIVNGNPLEIYHPNQFVMSLKPQLWERMRGESVALTDFKVCERPFAISGIGNPQRFFDTLMELNIDACTQAFADHHNYLLEDLTQYSGKVLLMTAKDAIKCRQYVDQLDCSQWYFLQVEACFGDDFYDFIDRQVARVSST